MKNILEDDPLMIDLRKRYPKKGPDPKPSEPIEKWAERFLKWFREQHPELKKED